MTNLNLGENANLWMCKMNLLKISDEWTAQPLHVHMPHSKWDMCLLQCVRTMTPKTDWHKPHYEKCIQTYTRTKVMRRSRCLSFSCCAEDTSDCVPARCCVHQCLTTPIETWTAGTLWCNALCNKKGEGHWEYGGSANMSPCVACRLEASILGGGKTLALAFALALNLALGAMLQELEPTSDAKTCVIHNRT